jgi:hypothetical protein
MAFPPERYEDIQKRLEEEEEKRRQEIAGQKPRDLGEYVEHEILNPSAPPPDYEEL